MKDYGIIVMSAMGEAESSLASLLTRGEIVALIGDWPFTGVSVPQCHRCTEDACRGCPFFLK